MLIHLSTLPHLHLDLRYATTHNFTGTNLYGAKDFAFLHEFAAKKLAHAAELLQQEQPGWKFLIFDALRPRDMQRKLFDFVKDTPQQDYVADPDLGSVHSFGMAVDLGLRDLEGREVDMGTEFDAFYDLAHPKEEQWLKEGRLTESQAANRLLLKRVMLGAGFLQSPIEWWHFNALPARQVRAEFKIIEE